MDIKNNLTYRYQRFDKFKQTGYTPYDYEQNGILTKCLPKILFKGNTIFVTFLQLIDVRIIMILKYIDKLNHFKHISYYR